MEWISDALAADGTNVVCEDDMGRYVPKTYNNRRVLRTIVGTVIFLAVAAVVVFLLLFFVLEKYFYEGNLEIPWLVDEMRALMGGIC